MGYARADQYEWDDWQEEDLAGVVRRRDRGKMPVSRESRAGAASKATWRSKQVTKRFSRASDGIRNRRKKKMI